MMSKKGQGLALISILVLVAILYFVFKYNTDTYSFIMTAGDEQAHLVTAYTEGAKAQSFVQIAARQAAFETIWNLSGKSQEASALGTCEKNLAFPSDFKARFNKYLSLYAPATDLVSTSIPDYDLSFDCSSGNNLKIEGRGYSQKCVLSRTFPFPKYPCEDQDNRTNCTNMNFAQSATYNNGKACTWTTDLNCAESLPQPACSAANDKDTCNAIKAKDGNPYCQWQVSYAEPVSVVSAPLINYQFSVDTNAHFIENISGTEYVQFTNARIKAFKPGCIISVPANLLNNTAFDISILYTGETEPSDIRLQVSHSFAQFADRNLSTGINGLDANDKSYEDGKSYYYTITLTNNTYYAYVSCKDSNSNSVTATKDFTVLPPPQT